MPFTQIITTKILGKKQFVTALHKRHDDRLIPEYSVKEADAKRFKDAKAVLDNIYNTHNFDFEVKEINKTEKEKPDKPGNGKLD